MPIRGFPGKGRFRFRSLRKAARKRRPQFEQLENRRVLAGISPPTEPLELSAEALAVMPARFADGQTAGVVTVSRDGTLDVTLSQADAWQTRVTTTPVPGPIIAATTSLVNADGLDDLLLLSETHLHVLINGGMGEWEEIQAVAYAGAEHTDAQSQATVSNLNGDFLADLIFPFSQTGQVALFEGRSSGGFSPPTYLSTRGGSPQSVAVGHFVGDPHVDLIVGHAEGQIEFFEGQSNGGWRSREDLSIDSLGGSIMDLEVLAAEAGQSNEVLVTSTQGVWLLQPNGDPLPSLPLVNGDFTQGLDGWQVTAVGESANTEKGLISAEAGFVQLRDNNSFLTSLSQTLVIPRNPQAITFDVLGLGLKAAGDGQLPDAFEVSLLNLNSDSLLPTHNSQSTAFLNYGPGQVVSASSAVTFDGSTVRVDISSVPAGSEATLVFDLIGTNLENVSSATLDNVRVLPDVLRDDSFGIVPLPGPFASLVDSSVGDVDGDGTLEIVTSDSGSSTVVVFERDAAEGFSRQVFELGDLGVPSRLALGPLVSPEASLDIAVGIQDRPILVSPLGDSIARGQSLPTIDFEYSAEGGLLQVGDRVDGRFSSLGVTISTHNPETAGIVFDSGSPGAWPQLGTPNEFYSGPGVGDGGGPGDGPNDQPLQKVLVLSEHSQSSPSPTGGSIFIDFDQPTRIDEVHLLNVTSDGTLVRLYDAAGNLIRVRRAAALGPNSFQELWLGASLVQRMEIVLSGPAGVAAIVSQRNNAPVAAAKTRFFVPDHSDKAAYLYSPAGQGLGEISLSGSGSPRGAATTALGDLLWTVHTNKRVRVHDSQSGECIGSWRAKGVSSPEGIATDGRHVWIVDKAKDRVYRFGDAADRRHGRQSPDDWFRLARGNKHPTGLTTDGEFLWVSDAKSDRVFVYDVHGNWINSWRLDPRNRNPSGLTISPEDERLWVVDIRDKKVYTYAQRTLDTLSYQWASESFALSAANKHPQGIADPTGNITIGETINASLAAEDTFEWSFNAEAGQDIYVNFQALSGTQLFEFPTTSLIAPDGSTVYAESGRRTFDHDSGVQRLPLDGVYTLRMSTPIDVSFQFTLFDVPAPDVNAIEFGQLYAGQIETPGVQDWWNFEAAQGSRIALDIQSLNTAVRGDLTASVLGPDGSVISSRTSILSSGLDQQVELPEEGSYTVVFKAGYDGSQLPSYSFQVTEIPEDDILPIEYREIADGGIEAAGARDQWIFQADAGDEIFVDFLEVTGGDLQVTLTSPSGSELYDVSFSREYGLDRQLVLAESGEHILSVQAAFSANTLHDYQFQIWDVPPTVPQVGLLNAPLQGNLVPGEKQEYWIDIAEKSDLLFDAIETQAASLSLQLLTPDGEPLTQRLTQDQLIEVTQPGTYRALVQRTSDLSTARDAKGNYVFRLQDVTRRDQGLIDNLGTRFYLAFPRNLREFLDTNSTELSITLTAERDTSGALLIPFSDTYSTFDIIAGEPLTIELPANLELFTNDQVSNRGIIVSTLDEVAVYGLNQRSTSTDGFTALPVDAVGQDYVVMGYGNTARLIVGGGSHMAIVGTQDDTLVSITPSVDVEGHSAGETFTVALDEAQVFFLYADAAASANLLDLTGTQITSSSPVSVFGGSTGAFVPAGFRAADHLIEQLPATNTWGSRFLTTPLATRTGGDTFRVLAKEDDTQVSINGELLTTLTAFEVYETILAEASIIETSRPSLVAQYSNGSTFDQVTSDPFMMLVPPVDQYQSQYSLSTPSNGIDANFANLIVPDGALDGVLLDGQPVDPALFTSLGASGFSAASLPISIGSHRFVAAEPFGVSIYGFDQFDSYGYFGGMKLEPLAAVSNLTIQPVAADLALNTSQTITAIVEDENGQGLNGIRVEFAISGANPNDFVAYTDASGRASINYAGSQPGSDIIVAAAVGLTAQTTINWLAAPPAVSISSPEPGAELEVGDYVVEGHAVAGLPGATIVDVLVNGQPVVRDVSGRFFAELQIEEGLNPVHVVATDNFGQTTTESVAWTGFETASQSAFSTAKDRSAATAVYFSGTTFDRSRSELWVNMQLENLGETSIFSTVTARLDRLNSARVALANADALSEAGEALVLFEQAFQGGFSSQRELVFSNPARDSFAPEFSILSESIVEPRFLSLPSPQAVVGQSYMYQPEVIADDRLPMHFELLTAPEQMSLDPLSGLISWVPAVGDRGAHDLSISVLNAEGATATQSFTLSVVEQPPNRPPRFISSPKTQVLPGEEYRYEITGIDEDHDLLSFALLAGPTGMTLDGTTSELVWENPALGVYSIEVEARDGRGGRASQRFDLNVGTTGSLSPPSIVSTPPVVAVVGDYYVYNVAVQSSDFEELSFRLLESPDGMQVDPTTGRLTWRPTSEDLGSASVLVQAAASAGAFASQSFTIQVEMQRDNLPPAFVSTPSRVATVDELYQYQARAEDDSDATLQYSLLAGPTGMWIDVDQGVIQWSPEASDVGSHRILLHASDVDGGIAYQQFELDVRRVNTPPMFVSEPIETIQVGDFYRYNARAVDLEDAVRYVLAEAPSVDGGMQIDPRSGAITWQPKLAAIGEHVVTVQAIDERGFTREQAFTLVVQPDLEPPQIAIALADSRVTLNQLTEISLQAVDNLGIGNLQLLADDVPLELESGKAFFTSDQSGFVYLTAIATDVSGNIAYDYEVLQVGDVADSTPPLVRIESPQFDDDVTYLTDVFGTVTDENLESYRLEYSRLGSNSWQTLAQARVTDGTSIELNNARLASFDPSLLPNDQYELRLSAEDLNGNSAFDTLIVSVRGQAKIGNYQLEFTDLQMPLAGIPIEIKRVYDTLYADDSMDFGYGWMLDVASPRIRETVPISPVEAAGGGALAANPLRFNSRVYLNAPDGRRVGFTFRPQPQPGLLGTIWRPEFVADPGVYDRLEVENVALSQRADGTFGMYLTGLPYNPDRYSLVTRDQHRYSYDQFADIQLTSITDRNGVQLDFREDGIYSSVGPAITWERDEAGRIVRVFDPAGGQLRYDYDENGDLVQFLDQSHDAWTFQYSPDAAHRVERVLGPRGNLLQEVQYDQAGRFVAIVDALGNSVRQEYSLPDNFFTQTDPLGNATVFSYDDLGNITQLIDALGNTTQFLFEDPQNPYLETALVDARGNRTEMDYDADGNPVRILEPDREMLLAYNQRNDLTQVTGPIPANPPDDFVPTVVSMNYDARGNLTEFTNANAERESFRYDAFGRLLSSTDARGNTMAMEYGDFEDPDLLIFPDGARRTVVRNQMGMVESATDEVGTSISFSYDASGRLNTSTNGLGNSYEYLYEDDLLVRSVDPLGRVTAFFYDDRNRLTRTVDPLGGLTLREYDENNRLISLTNPAGHTESWSYSPVGDVLSYTDALGRTTNYEYDEVSNLTAVQDARGFTTGYEYDSRNRLVSVVDALGNPELYEFDVRDNLIAVVDRNGFASNFDYDAVGRLTSATDPLGNQQSWRYDARGNVTAAIDELGNWTTREYDDRDRLVREIDAAGYEQGWEYDRGDRVVAYTDAEQNTWRYEYDAANQLVAVTDPLSGRRSYEYDAVGNRIKTEDELGRARETEYDALDRAIAEMDASGEFTRFEYDAIDNLISLTDPLGNVTRYRYNDANELVVRTDPLGQSASLEYDLVGNLTRSVDRLGRITDRAYDPLNRLVVESWLEPDESPLQEFTFEYDPVGNLLTASGPASAYSMQYDPLNRLIEVDNFGTPNLPNIVLSYDYDAVGNLLQVKDSFGVQVDSTFDGRNLLNSMTWTGGGIDDARLDFTRDGRGLATGISRYADLAGQDRVSQTITVFDALARATSIRHLSPATSVVASYSFDFDAAGQMTRQVVNGQVSDYSFDADGQLTDAINSGRADENYAYDANGNRIDADNVIGANNQLLDDGFHRYEYDAEGNLVRKIEKSSGEFTEYEYDHRNRLTAAIGFSSGGIVLRESQYRYDVFDRLLARSLDADGTGPLESQSKYTVYDGENAWADFDQQGRIEARYLFGQTLDSNIARWRPGEGTAWYLTDHLGSVREIVDGTGQVIDQLQYDSFGNILLETNPQAGDRFKFTGREWHPELGLYYYRSRFYDSSQGIFISQDPIGFASGDTNLQRYVGNDPLGYVDPTGNTEVAFYGRKVQTDLALVGARVGGIGGFLCGYIDEWYRSGVWERSFQQGVVTGLIGAAVGGAAPLLSGVGLFRSALPLLSNSLVRGGLIGGGVAISAGDIAFNSNSLAHGLAKTACLAGTGLYGAQAFGNTIGSKLNKATKSGALLFVAENLGVPRSAAQRVAREFESGTVGAFSLVAARQRFVPALRFKNPNPNGVSYVKFDGFSQLDNGIIELIDAKTRVVPFATRQGPFISPSVRDGLVRKSLAIEQNSGIRGVLEFPDAAARREGQRVLRQLGITNISTRVR